MDDVVGIFQIICFPSGPIMGSDDIYYLDVFIMTFLITNTIWKKTYGVDNDYLIVSFTHIARHNVVIFPFPVRFLSLGL